MLEEPPNHKTDGNWHGECADTRDEDLHLWINKALRIGVNTASCTGDSSLEIVLHLRLEVRRELRAGGVVPIAIALLSRYEQVCAS